MSAATSTGQAKGRLDVDDALSSLALIPLARDIATRFERLIIAVEEGLPKATGGGIWYPLPKDNAGVIMIAPSQVEDLEEVLAHELAHALDDWTVTREEREDFAEAAAPILLEHRPATVREALRVLASVLGEPSIPTL